MKKHICKQCNKVYEYCRGCLLSPISYKENGYCSETCYEASKNKVEPIVEDVIETIIIEDIAPVETEMSLEVESDTIVEEEISVEVEPETIVLEGTPIIETIDVVEPTIKNETNTYKKKKNKYRVHE